MGLFAFLASFAYSYRQAQLLLGIVYWVVIGPRWFTTVYNHFRNGKHGRRFPWRRVLATEAVPLVTVIAASYLIWWLMEQATVPYAGFQRRDRIVTFIIERHWNSSLVPGSVQNCTSGGFNHATTLLSPFFQIASFLHPERRPVILRPRYVLEQMHDLVPESTQWKDWFDWDADHDEFKSTEDIYQAYLADPSRVQFFDIYDDPYYTLRKMRRANAEVVVIHMYGTPAADCYSSEPMKDMAHPALITVANDDLRSFSDDVTYEPSAFMVDAARLIVGRLGGEGKFSTIHARRGDVLLFGRYYDFSPAELAKATSAGNIAKAVVQHLRDDEDVVLFTNEKNLSMFDSLKRRFGARFHYFEDLVAALPLKERTFFQDGYSAYLLAKQIVPQNRFHICTADSKLGAAQCDAHLAVHPVATTASTPVPASSNEVNESANHAAAELALGIDTN